jgi:hypothetical protein
VEIAEGGKGDVRRLVHRLARDYRVGDSMQPVPDCPDCAELMSAQTGRRTNEILVFSQCTCVRNVRRVRDLGHRRCHDVPCAYPQKSRSLPGVLVIDLRDFTEFHTVFFRLEND